MYLHDYYTTASGCGGNKCDGVCYGDGNDGSGDYGGGK